MINKKLDAIMCDYVSQASDFCKSYVKEVTDKSYSSYSYTIQNIFSTFEDTLWRLKHETEVKMYEAVDIALNTGENTDDTKYYQADLFSMHSYYHNHYSAKIVECLAKQWHEASNKAVCEMTINQLKRLANKGGVDNGK